MVSNQIAATATQQGTPIEALFAEIVTLPAEDFQQAFRRMRRMYPEDIARLCIRFIGEDKRPEISPQILNWLSNTEYYLEALLDPDFLPLQTARQLIYRFRQSDPKFFTKLLNLTGQPDTPIHPRKLRRALDLFEMYGDSDVLVPWLRALTTNADKRIRSKAVKIFCRFRPNRMLIERQLVSEDGRIRANSLEAIWGSNTAESEFIFLRAIKDENHRVVVNGLVGLYKAAGPRQAFAFEQMLALTRHPSPLFRRAAIWALNQTLNPAALPALQELVNDPDPLVRVKALRAINTLPPIEPAQPGPEAEPPVNLEMEVVPTEKPEPEPTEPVQPPHVEDTPSCNRPVPTFRTF